jgi:hypothetical protein
MPLFVLVMLVLGTSIHEFFLGVPEKKRVDGRPSPTMTSNKKGR